MEPTLLGMFGATVTTCGDRPAIDTPDMVLTYDELAIAARSVAERLRDRGVGRGDRVGVRVASEIADLYVAILGALTSGAAYVPVDADDPSSRAEQIFTEADVCVTIGDGLELVWRRAGSGHREPPAPDDDAWVIFTSGSTDAPKGGAISHRAAMALVRSEDKLWKVSADDRVLAGLPGAFEASCGAIWLAWSHGAALVPAPRALVRSGVELGPWLKERGVTVISTVPTFPGI